MIKPFLFFLFLLAASTGRAQNDSRIAREEWAPKPALHTVDGKYSHESAVIILDKRRVQYLDVTKERIVEYRTLHKIIRVNDDKGIEYYNKIYLGFRNDTDIVDMHARTILPAGGVIEVGIDKMKDFEEKDGSKYKIFAMEGLVKGSEIEYTSTLKRDLNFFGKETFQIKYPVLDAEMEIRCPERLIFQIKGYNCSPATSDTNTKDDTVFSARLTDIPGAEDEKYAAYEANLQRLEYRLSYNTADGGTYPAQHLECIGQTGL